MKQFSVTCHLYLAACLLWLAACGDKPEAEESKTGKEKNIVETGELAAVNNRAFVLSRYGRYWYEMRVIGILEHGTIVNPGDSIIQLDPTEIKRFIIERESNLETERANLEKLRVDQDNRINDLTTNIKNERATFNLKKIELESSRFETERLRKIKELEFKQAEITLAKEEQRLELAKTINYNELKIQEIRVSQVQNEIENAYALLPALTLRSPIAGVFQIAHNWRTGNLLKVGDNIYPGNNMANVPELSRMKVNTFINETDFLKIHLKQKASVRLDALPETVFEGEVSYIGKLCHRKDRNNKSRQKVFDVEVLILKSDPRLKPGMTVSCEYLND
ncbi:MAG: efflux RND transporter periplasmic adaptor subunit [Dysgonamonadaceae bacterium]|jgi:multidrug efflux pump subunit AcrA (membrane-fusion protein)|nr:efflux RND transporter periplasmic adaptor subunit [Dysgonamonadaceae bacterium]